MTTEVEGRLQPCAHQAMLRLRTLAWQRVERTISHAAPLAPWYRGMREALIHEHAACAAVAPPLKFQR